MPQENNKGELTKPLSTESVKAGKVRPFDKKEIKWTKNVDPDKNGTIEEVHPALADKLVKAGKAEYPNGKK